MLNKMSRPPCPIFQIILSPLRVILVTMPSIKIALWSRGRLLRSRECTSYASRFYSWCQC